MTSLLLLPLCLIAGLTLKRTRIFNEASATALNTFIIWLALPAVVLMMVPEMLRTLHPTCDLLIPALAVWLAFLLTAALVAAASCVWKLSRATQGALILTAGLGNTSFVGFPLIEALYGSEGLKHALILDQLGSFLVLSTLGLFTASSYAGRTTSFSQATRRILTFPPFIATIIATLVALLAPFAPGLYTALLPTLQKLAATLVPLALVSVGIQLHFDVSRLKRRRRELSIGLALKLMIVPGIAALVLTLSGQLVELPAKITVLELGMGPMITGAIVASEFGLDPELASLMVGVGTPLSVLTAWLWNLIL